MGKSPRRQNYLVAAAFHHNSMSDQPDNHDHSKKKKLMIHRENERQRRQEMATLHAALRCLLPLELIKEKRSISDHLNEAVNYIKHLRNRIMRLDAKRAQLKRLSINSISTGTISSSSSTDQRGESSPSSSCAFSIDPCCGGVQIVVSTTTTTTSTDHSGFGSRVDGLSPSAFSISRFLGVALEQGLSVVSCVSSKLNDQRLVHTIHCEVDDVGSMSFSRLEQKLVQAFPSSRCTYLNKY